jgi:hypothetical protein
MTQTIALLLRMCGADSEQFHLNGAPIALHGIPLPRVTYQPPLQ